ncbi:MAG: DUF4364 family protein [Oscillospiraceae bacterium]|nr:DUF4364 family protein [Oscillospiraceae bacterium]MCL2278708.1 DUF4364 family protein [Oscillospiraceae bacterium]
MIDNIGFIHEKIEIKMLILFVMRRLPEPVALEVLTELAMCDEGISYFDVTDCILKLVETKHLHLSDGMYALTAKGERNGEILEENLPYSVKSKAEDLTAKVRAAMGRNAMIKTNRTEKDSNGYSVALSLSDGVGEILSMEIFAINEKQADKLEKGFRKNAEEIYHSVMKLIIGKS